MPDRRRIVTLDSAGAATTVKDFEDGVSYFALQSTFQVHPGAVKPVMAERQRPFGGSTAVADTQDNGTIAWSAHVKSTTADGALARAEEIFALLRAGRRDLWVEWRAIGATNSTFYEVRGPATLTPTYESRQFGDSKSWKVDIEIPIAPLGRFSPIVITISSTTLPAVVSLGTTIPGSAPALADVTLRTSGGAAPPIWALIGWTKRVPSSGAGAPLSGSVAPFGILEAESATNLVGWAVTAEGSGGSWRGATGLYKLGSGAAETVSAMWPVDPSVLQADAYAAGEVRVEVWGRFDLQQPTVSPTAVLSMQPAAGTAFGAEQFSAEYGSVGKTLVAPASGFARRMVRLGTLTMPVDPAQPLKWNVKVALSWAAGTSGGQALDYLLMVPERQRALGPTGKPNDSTYPKFIASTADTQKRIRGGDLSGRVASGTGNFGRDAGLGGSPIELPPGDVDMLLKLSSLVPDDPSVDTSSEQLSHTGVTGTVTVWPRFWIANGV